MAIGDADQTMPDGWSEPDRRQVAQRRLSGLGEQVPLAAAWLDGPETRVCWVRLLAK